MSTPNRPNDPSGGNGGTGGMDEPGDTGKKDAAASTKKLDAEEEDPSPPADASAPPADLSSGNRTDTKPASGADRGGGGGGDGGGAAAVTFTELWMKIFGMPMGQPQSCAGTNCHNPGKKDMVDFSSQANAYASLTRANGPVVKGNPTGSKLYTRITSTNVSQRMPLGKPPLAKELTDKVRAWIAAGANND